MDTDDSRLGLPGEYPYTRGIHPDMYRGKPWTMRQYAGYGAAAETNRRFKYLIANGQTGLSVAFDLPTQIGLDSDHPLALGEVGRVGVPISTLADMETLFEGIPLESVSTSMTINATAPILLAMYASVAKKQGAPLDRLSGTVQNDILKEYLARGTQIYPPRFSLRLITDVFAWCRDTIPHWNTISISGYHIREAGATAAQELAFTFGNAVSYVQAARDRGMEIDEFGPRLSFFFAVHNDFLEEIAKFRAARRLWANLARNRFGARNPRTWMARFHAQTAGSTLTAQQPDNNIARVALQALAAALGGAQSMHTNSRDEALALPTEEAARIALRTQQILAHESGIVNTVDPCGGSEAIEALTDRLEQETLDYLDRIDRMGGMLAAIESGWAQREIQDSAYRCQRAIEAGEQIVVGVNGYRSGDDVPIPLLAVDPALERGQVARLADYRAQRNQTAAVDAVTQLESASRTEENLMPLILTAIEAGATVGEISDAFRRAHGEYRENAI